MASNEKQQNRRKRIMEKGIDRMALITGQIKNLEESVTPKAGANPNADIAANPTHHSHTESSPPVMVTQDFLNSINASIAAASSADELPATSSKLVKLRTISESPSSNLGVIPIPKDIEEKTPNTITNNTDTNTNINTSTNTNVASTNTSTNVVSTNTNASTNSNFNVFSSKRINQSIICSERIRAICSLVIGLLVIVMGSERFITSRPFYLILLTDISIVVARVLGEVIVEDKRTGSGSDIGDNNNNGENWDDAFKLVERGLVLYQAIRAIFIDSSIYLVIVIFGLSI